MSYLKLGMTIPLLELMSVICLFMAMMAELSRSCLGCLSFPFTRGSLAAILRLTPVIGHRMKGVLSKHFRLQFMASSLLLMSSINCSLVSKGRETALVCLFLSVIEHMPPRMTIHSQGLEFIISFTRLSRSSRSEPPTALTRTLKPRGGLRSDSKSVPLESATT